MVCPLYRGCPLLRRSNRIILIGGIKFGDLVFVHCGEVFNTVSLSRRVLFERFHCNRFHHELACNPLEFIVGVTDRAMCSILYI